MGERSGGEASVRWQAKMSASKENLACRLRFQTLVTVSPLVEHLAGVDWAAGATLDDGEYALRAATSETERSWINSMMKFWMNCCSGR